MMVMDSNPPAAERDLSPSPGGIPTLWFDVVNEVTRSDTRPHQFRFCFANLGICGPVDSGKYEITLRCEGAGASHERSFVIEKGWDDHFHEPTRLSMKPLV